jgi:tRNA (guanine9-N1)-methyltransferase
MSPKEVTSLASQIRYCYSDNRRSPHPVFVSATSFGGETRAVLERIDGFPEGWVGRGFDCHTESMEKVHDPSKLVYLTSDSPNVLDDLDNDKVYVIGGIVDRNRLKRATMDRAKELGIATAKLPITQHLKLFTTKVLTCNHVFGILLKYRDCGKDWKKAMLEVLPKRKDIQGK